MVVARLIAGTGLAAALAVAVTLAPAIGAENDRGIAPRRAAGTQRAGIGSFTPASADPRLAAVLARAGIGASGFRFTPAADGRGGTRSVTVAVRARSNRDAQVATLQAAPVALAPIAYNLGAAVGWKRFALSGDVSHVDLAGAPGSSEGVDVGLSYTGRSFSGRVKAATQHPIGNQPKALVDQPAYSIDVGGAYRLTRNLDVIAGARYKSERERLPQLTDNRRDSQSVYVGTAFRF